jgi:hypothetical protein
MSILAIVAALSVAGSGPVPSGAPAPRLDGAQASATSLRDLARRMGDALEREDFSAALAAVKAMEAHKDFAAQPQAMRDAVRDTIGGLNFETGNIGAAIPYLRATASRPGAEPAVWLSLISAEAQTDDWTGAARDMTTLLTRRPDSLDTVSDRFLTQLAVNTRVEADTGFALRLRLAALSWSYEHNSGVWLKLIDDLVARDRTAEALPLIGKVTESSARIRLHAMKTYDGLMTASGQPALDVATLFDAELERKRGKAAAPDAEIQTRLDFGQALLSRARFDDALAESDAILALPEETWKKDDDPDGNRRWAGDLRSRALMALGRRDDALSVARTAAADVAEDGDTVSHRINLGAYLMRLGRFQEAIDTVGVFEPKEASPFGLMQAAQVRACAAQALGAGNGAAVTIADREFAYLSEHRKDAPDAWAGALGCRGDVDGIAALMIERLDDPEQAAGAVEMLHAYLPTPAPTAFDSRVEAPFREAYARPEVIAARDRVGRGLVIPTTGPQF